MNSKLVRDEIPRLIRESGKDLRAHIADTTEYRNLIIEKMREELLEFEEEPSLEEAADIYEVFLAMLTAHGMPLTEVKSHAHQKGIARGKFKLGIVLDEIILK